MSANRNNKHHEKKSTKNIAEERLLGLKGWVFQLVPKQQHLVNPT
jgi:hypothetical protein